MALQKIVDPIDPGDLGRPEWPIHHQTRLQSGGFTDPDSTPGSQTPIGDKGGVQGSAFVALSEVWFRRAGRWQKMRIAWNVKHGPKQVSYDEQPFPRPPYRLALARPIPGEHYTTGMMHDIEPLNIWLNDQVNLLQDAQFMAMSPPALINPAAIFREDSLVYRPRAKWLVDPAGVQWPQIQDTTRAGQAGVSMVMGLIDAFSASNPLADGTPQRGMPRAGFAISSLISLALADIKGTCELVEDEILTPLLSDLHTLAVVYTPERQRLKLPATMGLPNRIVAIDELYGDWTFRWVGSLQSNDLQVRAQRLVTFFGLVAKAAPVMAQSGYTVQWGDFVQRIFRDALGERGADTLLHKMDPQEMAQMMAMMQAQRPAAGGGSSGVPPGANAPVPAGAEEAGRQQARQLMGGEVGTALQGTRG